MCLGLMGELFILDSEGFLSPVLGRLHLCSLRPYLWWGFE